MGAVSIWPFPGRHRLLLWAAALAVTTVASGMVLPAPWAASWARGVWLRGLPVVAPVRAWLAQHLIPWAATGWAGATGAYLLQRYPTSAAWRTWTWAGLGALGGALAVPAAAWGWPDWVGGWWLVQTGCWLGAAVSLVVAAALAPRTIEPNGRWRRPRASRGFESVTLLWALVAAGALVWQHRLAVPPTLPAPTLASGARVAFATAGMVPACLPLAMAALCLLRPVAAARQDLLAGTVAAAGGVVAWTSVVWWRWLPAVAAAWCETVLGLGVVSVLGYVLARNRQGGKGSDRLRPRRVPAGRPGRRWDTQP